jgi:lipopolysaccharide/colanic/teichoic acid biosynthesis glycosyltransferase
MKYIKIKGMLDFISALILIIILFIPMLIIAIIILIDTKSWFIYKQKRIGKDGKEFSIYKYKTMKLNKEKKLEVTRSGKFLRKTGLDELPQLINIIKGEMSFIGPRPWIKEYFINFNSEQKKRQLVLPGITGLAQVEGNSNTILKKINLDIQYVDNISCTMDISILIKTIYMILTMKKYDSNENLIKLEIEQLKNNNGAING